MTFLIDLVWFSAAEEYNTVDYVRNDQNDKVKTDGKSCFQFWDLVIIKAVKCPSVGKQRYYSCVPVEPSLFQFLRASRNNSFVLLVQDFVVRWSCANYSDRRNHKKVKGCRSNDALRA